MHLQLERKDWKAIFPKAPNAVIDAFDRNPKPLDDAGVTMSRTRLAYTLANVEHECGGFTIRDLTENINYTAKRMAEVWPKRFKSAADVEARFGTAKGWQKKAFDEIYGDRMGNRPGTDDGSRYIGRGGPQITGRDGYIQVGERCGLDLVTNPDLATLAENQPAIIAAFFDWKGLGKLADKGKFKPFVKAWNGGIIGLADREEMMKGNDPIIAKLNNVAHFLPFVDLLAVKEDAPVAMPFGAAADSLGAVSDFVTRLVRICDEECTTFGDGAKKEYQDAVFLRVGDYWTELAKTPGYAKWAGYNGKSDVTFGEKGKFLSNRKNQPWSAAFISFVMRRAGAGTEFSYSSSHSVYVVEALDAAKKTKPKEKFIARRHKEYTPKLGDLIACERRPDIDPNFDTYKAFVAAKKFEAHCDVVTEVHDKHLVTIGGNVGDSVTRKKWPLDAKRRIDNRDPKSATAGVICVIENLL